jgi:hypothetical protein
MTDEPTIHVHRFRERIAIATPGGPTVYLTGDAALHLARLLRRGAGDLTRLPFAESKFDSAYVNINTGDSVNGHERYPS